MAITTLSQLVSGLRPTQDVIKYNALSTGTGRYPYSHWYINPGTASAPSSGIGGEVLTQPVTGQIPFPDSASSGYFANISNGSVVGGAVLLCDRLWQNSGIDVTAITEQTFTASAQIPARDITGTNNGVGVFAMVETYSATGAGVPTYTLKYTNQSGTADKTATNIHATNSSFGALGSCSFFGLADGDTGVQKAQSITLSETQTSGNIQVVLFRPIALILLNRLAVTDGASALSAGFSRVYNGSVPFLIQLPVASPSASNRLYSSHSVQFTDG